MGWKDYALLLLFAFMLALFGAILIHQGWNDIQRRYSEFSWRTKGIHHARGTIVLRGTAAVRQGVGCMAFGGMLGIWAAGVLLTVFQRRTETDMDEESSRAHPLGWLLLACLLTAFGCLLPPWETAGQCSLAVMALTSLMFLGPAKDFLRQHAAKIFPALIALSIVSDYAGYLAASVGIALGIFWR